MRQKVRQAVVIQEGVRDFETIDWMPIWYVVVSLVFLFLLIPAVSAETLGSESLKVARLTSSLKVMWICMSVAYFRS